MLLRSLRSSIKGLVPEGLVVRRLPAPVEKRLLLTFDDGPNPEVTPLVLERLAAVKARGVFFVVGRLVDAAPQVLPLIEQGGHVIGNHSYGHRNDRDPCIWSRTSVTCRSAKR